MGNNKKGAPEGAGRSVAGVFSSIIGRNKDDGKIATTVKILTPYGSIEKSISSFSESKDRLGDLLDAASPSVVGAKFSDVVVNPSIDPEIILGNIKKLRLISRSLILAGMFVLVDIVIFLSFQFWMAVVSIPAVALCYILAAKYALIARAMKEGEFSHPSVKAFILDKNNLWLREIFLSAE